MFKITPTALKTLSTSVYILVTDIRFILFSFVRYNLPLPQEETMKASVVEARLRSKLRESFQVRFTFSSKYGEMIQQ